MEHSINDPVQIVDKQKAETAQTSLVLGVLSFIPLIGVPLGIFAIIFGIRGLIKGKKRAALSVVLGVSGILFTCAVYGSLYYFGFIAKDGPFAEMKNELSAQLLMQDAGLIELYKSKNGKYPASFSELEAAGYVPIPADHYLKPFHYQLSEDGMSYDLRSLGPDGLYGTPDDIFPKDPSGN
jgi:hypothetical protein